jgi:hypothetical protein
LFSDILKFPGNIVEKVQNLIVDEQCFDGALISILQKTIFNTQNQDKLSAIVQDYKTETESISMSSVSQYLQESAPESQGPPAVVNPQKTNTSTFKAFSGMRVDTSAFNRAEKEQPFLGLIVKSEFNKSGEDA